MLKVLGKSVFTIGWHTKTICGNPQPRSSSILATAFVLPLMLFAQVALAAVPVVNTTISLEKTGSEPFDAVSWTGDGPGGVVGGVNAGLDADENDNIVRLQDSITYRVEASVNDSDVEDFTATVLANEKQKWIIIPTGCKTDPGDVGPAGVSEIRDSGAELFCNMGPAIEGTTRIFFPASRAVGVDPRDPSLITRNDDIVTASVTAQANPSGANPSNIAADGPTSVVVTGFFRVDLQKGLKVTALDPDTMQPLYLAPAKDGAAPGNRPGSLIEYTIKAVYVKGSLIADGADEAGGDFTADYSIVDVYTDDNDNNNLGGLSTGGILYDWDPSTPACELLGDHGAGATVSCAQLIAAIDDIGAGAAPPDGINDAAIRIDLTDINVSDPDADGNLFEIRLNIWFDRDNDIRTHQDCVGTDCTVFVTNRIGLWDGVGTVLSPFDEDTDPNVVSTEDASMNNIDNYNDGIEPFPNEISYPLEFRLPGTHSVYKSFTDLFPFAVDKAPDQSMAAGETRPFLLNVFDYRKIDQGETQVCDKIDTQVWEYAGVAPPNQIGSPALYPWNQNQPFNPVMSTFAGAVGTTLGDGSALVDFYFTNLLYTADPIADQAGYISELRTATCEDDVSGDGNVVIVNEAGNTVDENGDPTVITEIDWWLDANMVPPVGGGVGSSANVTRLRQDSIYDAAAALAQDPTHGRFAIAVNHLITAKIIATSPYGTNNRLPNFASTRRDEGDENFIAWRHGPPTAEDPAADATFSISTRLVDRMTLIPSSHSIEKYTDPRGIKVVRGGDNIDFIINPKVFGLWNDLIDNTANIDDNLPNGTAYVANSEMFSSDGGASWYSRVDWDARFIAGMEDISVDSAAHVAGADPLNWDFGSLNSSVTGSDQLPLIKYTVFVDPARVSGTFINIAQIDSGAIGGGIKEARYQLTILPDFGLDVLKIVDDPIHQVNSPFSFNLVYKNLGGDDFTGGEFIDILPYNGDADPGVTTGGINSNRDPESNYNGIYDISAVSLSNGETFFATIVDPATIEEDPCHASNLPLGFDPSIPSGVCSLYYAREGTLPGGGAVGTNSSNWVECTTLNPLICGALDNTDITAIKFTAPSLLAAEGGQTVTIEFEPLGNLGGTPDLDSEGKVTAASTGDIYTNTFGGRVSEISLNVISNDVSVTMVSGSIGDTVWFDLDADGNGPAGAGDESDITEPPIVGAQVVLLDASGDPVLIDPDTGAVVTAGYVNPVSGNPAIPYTATTDGNGQYQFDNLPAGTYSVEVTPPLGTTPTFDADGIGTPNISTHDLTPITDAAGQLVGVEDNTDQDFGYIPPLQVGSTVWLDINNDGIQASNGTEPGIAGITVQLFSEGDDPLTATPVATAVTDANGDYIMNTGSAGNYFIYLPVPPSGASLSSSDIVSSGGDNGVDADDNGLQVSAGDSVQSPVFNLDYGTEPTGAAENGLTGGAQDDVLDNNGDMTIDFGFYPTGSIGDLVMIDLDGDGVLDPGDGDAGIGGVTVTLQYTDLDGQSVTLTTVTGLDGSYLFDNLPGNVTYAVTVDTATLPGTLDDDIRASYDVDGGLDNSSETTLDIVANQVVDDLDQDFGYIPLGTIGDTIWYDSNNDGVQDPGELGIGGVTVQLTPSPLVDLGNGPGIPITTVTDPDGTYLFDNLPIGDYQVDVISGLNPAYQQTGDPDASLDNHSEVTLALNPSDSTEVIGNLDQDFGYSEPVSVGGYVWEDLNLDGLQDSDEPGIAGSTVTLWVDDGTGNFVPATHYGGGVVADITVGQNGQYLFDNLPEGDYKIQISKPDQTLPSPVQQTADDNDTPNDSNIASEPTPDVFESGVFMLRGGLEPVESNTQPGDAQDDAASAIARDESGNMTVDFGFVFFVSLGSSVWLDANIDGVQGAGEVPIEGATMTLLNGDGTVYDSDPSTPAIDTLTAITDANGQYFFNDLIEGDYIVQLDASTSSSHPGQLLPTPPQIADPDNDSNTDSNIDIANALHDPVAELYFSGVMTLEAGTEPAGELNPLTSTADQPGQADAQPDASGNMTVDFGLVEYVSVGSTVWIDSDGNGLQDVGEPPIVGAMMTLMDATGLLAYDSEPGTSGIQALTALTDADGQYNFNQLPPGTYRIQVNLGTVMGGTALVPTPVQVSSPENNDNTDSNVDVNAIGGAPAIQIYQSGPITLLVGDEPANEIDSIGAGGADQPDQPGQTAVNPDDSGNMTVEFGFVKPMSIGSYVWEDTSLDGFQDPGEPGINGVTVNLLIEDPATPGSFVPAVNLDGDPVPATTTATVGADDGVYLFDNLPPGNYKVQVSDIPTGFVPSGSQTTGDDDDTDNDSNIASEPVTGTFESGEFALVVDNEPLAVDETQAGDSHDDTDADSEGNGNMTIDFGFVPTVSIGSFVWEDNGSDGADGTIPANIANGLQDADEPAIEGAMVSLLVDDGAGTFIPATDAVGAVVADQVTDTDGLYYFDNLPEGVYKVQVTPPAQFVPTLVQNGADDDIDNDSNIASEPVVDTTYESGEFTLELGAEPDTSAETQTGDDQDDLVETGGNMTVDLGFIQPVSMGSHVWEDTNGNGLQDAGEPAITEGTVMLVDAAGLAVTDLDGNPVLPIDLAVLADGQYFFDNLVPGIYKVQVTPLDPDYVPSPTQSTADDDIQNDSNIASEPTPGVTYESPLITLTAGLELVETAGEVGDDLDDAAIALDDAGNMTVDFGFVKPMSIGSYVWEDTNGDGTQDAAEVGINDVTVILLVEDPASPGDFIPAVDLDGAVVADVTTGNDGTDDGVYLFDNLPPGNYKVQVTDLPDGFMPSNTQTAGDDDVDDDSNIATEPTPGVVFESGIIALGVDEEPLSDDEGQPGDAQDDSDPADGNTESNGNMTIDFGFFQIVSIGSYVWEDLVIDGVQDDTEPAIEGAEVVLLVEDPANPGTFIPAVDIDGVAVDPQTTDVDGLYYFDMLPEGTYKVQVTPPAIFVPTLVQTDGDDADTTPADELDSNIADEPVAGTYESGAFELMAGEEPTESGDAMGDDQDDEMETSGNMTVDFGFIQPVSIGSYVWQDTNGDGLQDASEPAITAGTVELFNADGSPVTDLDDVAVGPIDLATTGGQYIFDNLVPGDYKVRVTPEDTTLLISPNQEPGDDDTENDSNIDVDSGAPDGSFESGVFTLTPGTEPTETGAEMSDDQDDAGIAAEDAGNMTVDFGFVPPVSLGSTVFFDNNNNGVQDDTDAGIPGVTVTLYEADGVTPVAGVDPVLTDEDGNYFFDGLLPGDYVVGVMAPTDAPTSSDGAGGDDQTDSDDNGIQDAPGDETLSEVITLLAGDEPEGDDEDGQGGDQDDDAIATDDAGDMTIDFGFVPPVSIGSTVFFDNDDNGMQGDDETGIPGVTVTLYQEVNGVLEPVPDVPPVVTDDEGNYLFEDLLPGIYVVGVIPLDHSPTSSTSDGSDDQVDSDDNGIQTASGDEAFSSPIDLEAGTEPEGESGQGGDQDADADDAGDMSVDFGFVPLPSDISLIKTRTDGYPIDLGDGSWRVRFDFEVENTGEVELTEVQIVDDLIAMLNSNAINDGVISEVELESPDMTLSPSPSYDGVGDTNMLDGTDVMSVGEIGHLQLTFKFTAAQFFGPFMNMGDVTGMPPNRVPEEDEDDAVVEVFDTEKPITLGWFSSSDQGNGEVIFEWSTQTEIGNVGYYLWSRAEGGQWSQLNEDMIVSQGDSLEEQVYQYRAFTAGDAFRLTDVSMSGKEVHHGPYQLGEQAGVRIERHPTDWDSIQRQSDEKQRAREQQRRDEMQRRLQQLQGSIDHKPALGLMSKAGLVMANLAGALISPAHALEMANFDVDAAGVYRVTHAQLVAAGLDLEGYASNRIGLKMANALAPLKILPLSSDTFGAGSSIEFPALGVDTLYAGSNVYTLVLDEGQNLIQADERTIPSGPPAYSYMAEVVHAPQNVYAHFSPDESDAWYAYRMDALNNNSASKSVSLSVTDHALAFHTSGATSDSRQIASKKPRLEVKLWGASTLAGDGEAEPDHHVTVSINGGEVADERFDGIRKHVLSKPLAQINSGSNTIKVDLPNDHSYPFDRVDIDSVKLLYPRQFKADDSGRSLVFPSSWNKFLLQKLSSTDVVVYRLDSDGNADQMMQHEGNCDAGAGNCIVSFAGVMSEADDSAVYFVSTEAGIKQPQIAMAPPHEALFDGEAKMLVIAHPDFIGTSLSTLEGYTASMAGIYGSSDLVNVESIYAQYSGQVMDANAVHQYIIDAVATRGTEHVMLVGGDMYDYRNNLGTSAKSFVPSLYIQTGQNQSTVPSDPKYADVDGDDIPDIDIARLPVRTEAELEVLLSKRQSYLSRSYTGSAVFSADKTDETGNDFDVTSEQWVSDYFSGWNVDRAYIDNMGSGAKQVVRDGINAGASLTSYTGHSSTVSWSFDDLFNSDDVSALTNAGKPTVVAQWGCWNTFYSSPEQESIAQKFLVEGDKGAVVVMGATSLGGADTEDAMADLLYARLSQGMRIGDAVLSAKRAFAEAFPGRLDMLLGWTVLGPADLTVN